MRTSTCILMLICMILPLAGCMAMSHGPQTPADRKRYRFFFAGIAITVNTPADPIIQALGEPEACAESPVPFLEGVEETYSYGSFTFTTYRKDGVRYIERVCLCSELASTEEGIRIGDPQSRVERVYGKECKTLPDTYVVAGEEMALVVQLQNRLVSAIRYELLWEPSPGYRPVSLMAGQS